jgi:3-oxoacyl-[acyl-carrier-protein] synthase II
VVTGAGIVHALGVGWDAVRESLAAGRDAFGRPRDVAAALRPGAVAVPCPLPDAKTHLRTPKLRKLMSDEALLATVAARRALAAAGLAAAPDRPVAGERLGAFVACGVTAANWRDLVPVFRESVDEDGALSLARFGERGLRRCNPLFAFQVLSNMPLCFVSIEEDVRGDNLTFAPWEGGGVQALAEAAASLRRGSCDAAVAVGASAMAGPHGVFWLARHGLLAPSGVRPAPFAHGPGGLAPADGAAALVVERPDDARRRGAAPLCAVAAIAQETDPTPSFAPCRDPATVARVVRRALEDAGADGRRIGAVCLSAAGDPEGDRAELLGVAEALGGLPPLVTAPARRFGSLFGAGPAAVLGLVAHALAQGGPSALPLPPEAPPAEVARTRRRSDAGGAVLVCAFGPGGAPSALVAEAVL